MKYLLIFSVCLALTLSLTNKEIIQQALNGAFEQNKLPDPVTIMPCIDDDSAAKIVAFIKVVLDKAAKGSPSDLISLIQIIKDFGPTLNPAVGECLNGNAQFEALGKKYGIDNTTESSVIEKKIIAYVTLHYLQVHKWLGDLDNDWNAGKYYNVGFQGATYGHAVLGLFKGCNKRRVGLTNKEIIQQTLNGLFEQNKLPDPVTIVPCIDDDSAAKIVAFIKVVLDKAAKGSPSDLISLIQIIKDFGPTLNPAVGECLNGNAQFEALGKKYGIDNTTESSVIEKKIIAYVTLHYLQVHKWLGDLDNDWNAGKYYNVGFQGATYGHAVLGVSKKAKIVSEIAQNSNLRSIVESKSSEMIAEELIKEILNFFKSS